MSDKWEVMNNGLEQYEVVNQDGETVAYINAAGDEDAANLIAAAPEMYSALDYVAGFKWTDGKTYRDHPAVTSALSKARGELEATNDQ